jgi:hypothetical protein
MIGAPSIARQIVEKAASSSRAMLGVPVLQKSRIVCHVHNPRKTARENQKTLPATGLESKL